ncbi:MAG TPA: class I SAM-dependent methyltransferase [Anaeromyxobacter sp.]|nr:class I SAM-dependent methyltransferase [Anaeromyxobacter sp.]
MRRRAVTAGPHWGDAYYGELYLASVADLLTPRLSALEAAAVAALVRLAPGERILDLACGHGRHARVLAGRARVVGLDRCAAYLGRGAAAAVGPAPAWVRGDVRALPFRGGAFDAAFSWYASLFMFDDRVNEACLAEAARVVRRGGRVLIHHANPLRLALEPRASARRALADGSVVEEESEFDAARGVDRCARRLVRPDGSVLAGTAELRYYMPTEWGRLAERAGLRLVELTTTTDAGRAPRREQGPESPDLIALLEKPT